MLARGSQGQGIRLGLFLWSDLSGEVGSGMGEEARQKILAAVIRKLSRYLIWESIGTRKL
jgi:hypothetical protein